MNVVRTLDIPLCQKIRRIVFIEGQNVPEAEEVDGRDEECLHYLLTREDKPIGTARVLPKGRTAKIGRVAILPAHRGRGHGDELMRGILQDLAGQFEIATLGSQTHAISFYEKLGFVAFGPEYDDAGILHRDMSRPL